LTLAPAANTAQKPPLAMIGLRSGLRMSS
jgi:hypothetical protein